MFSLAGLQYHMNLFQVHALYSLNSAHPVPELLIAIFNPGDVISRRFVNVVSRLTSFVLSLLYIVCSRRNQYNADR